MAKPWERLPWFERYRIALLETDSFALTASANLRAWCENNKNRCYIPEWLLAEWGITVDVYDVATRRQDTARSNVVSFVKTGKEQMAKGKRSA